MKKVLKGSSLAIILVFTFMIFPSYSRIQIYIGGIVDWQSKYEKLIFGDGYWRGSLTANYGPALRGILSEAAISHTLLGVSYPTLFQGTPLDFFKILLMEQSADIFKERRVRSGGYFSVGAFIYRHSSILLATEFRVGTKFSDINQKNETILIESIAPTPLKKYYDANQPKGDIIAIANAITSANNGQATNIQTFFQDNPSLAIPNTKNPTLYFDANIATTNTLKLTHRFQSEFNIRIGSIIKDRLFLFLLLGAEANNFSINLGSSPKSENPVVLYVATLKGDANASSYYYFTIAPKTNLNDYAMRFKARKFSYGATGGIGAEIFISKHLSFRPEVTFTYSSDVSFPSTCGKTKVLYSGSHFRASLGVFYRF
jgi:hypothetical protein